MANLTTKPTNYDDILNKLQAIPPTPTQGAGVPTNSTQPQTAGNRVSDFVNSPSGAALISGGLDLAKGVSNNKANAADAAAQRKQQLQMLLSQTADQEQSDNLSRDTAYLNSTQMNPVKQQQDIFRAGIMRAMGINGAPQIQRGQGVVNAPNFANEAKQYLGDDQLAAAAQRFHTAAGTVSNTAPPADLSKMGFKTDTSGLQKQMDTSIQGSRDERTALNQRRRDDLVGAIQQSGQEAEVAKHVEMQDDDWLEKNVPPPQGQHWHNGELSEDGSGFWHKFAKYAGIAGAGVATAMTGGAASPLLIAAIGAGSGAAAGWGSGGGTKAALMGAGLGAIPGGAASGGGRSALGLASKIAAPAVANAIKPGTGPMVSAGMDYFNRRGQQ